MSVAQWSPTAGRHDRAHRRRSVNSAGTSTVTSSTSSGNSAGLYDSGGAVRNFGSLTLISSTVSGNSPLRGGGLHNSDTSTLTNGTVGQLGMLAGPRCTTHRSRTQRRSSQTFSTSSGTTELPPKVLAEVQERSNEGAANRRGKHGNRVEVDWVGKGFNEAAANRRGKRPGSGLHYPPCVASMRPRQIAAENVQEAEDMPVIAALQ